MAAAREAFEKRKPVKQTFRMRRADGTTRMIRVAGAPSIDARGQVEAMHGVVVDKTDGHAALQAALNADSTVRRFVQAAPMPICMCDKEMRVLMASASWIAERRLTEEEVLGRIDLRHHAVVAGEVARDAPPGAARRGDEPRPRPV